MAFSSHDWVEALHRVIWGVEHLSAQPWLSPDESQSLVDVRVVGGQLLGEAFLRYAAPALRRELAVRVADVARRGESVYLRDWYVSAVAVCRLIFEQRRADLDAAIAARQAEFDAVWERTAAEVSAMSSEALQELCRGAGELAAGIGETGGRSLGAFLSGLLSSPATVAALALGAWLLFGGKGNRR
jgi:hypothetical protein